MQQKEFTNRKVLIVATSRKTRGGITSVINAYERGDEWKKFHCHWVQTHRDGSIWRKLFYMISGYIDFIFRIPFYDLVHFHISLTSTVRRKLPLFKLAKILGKKIIVHLHCGTQIDEIWNDNYTYLFDNSDLIVVLSENLKNKIQSKTNCHKNIEVLYNPCPQVSNSNNTIKHNEILFSGTLYESKGYKDLIKAFAKIAYNYLDWKVVFAGNGEIDEGKALAKKLGIENQVVFPGWVSGEEKEKLFNRAKIFCLPSYAEGFPMAVLDAWSYGLPVVTTPVGGIHDVAKDGENMLLFEPGDIDKLAENIETLINDRCIYNKISNASMEFANGRFSIQTINKQLEYIYHSLTTNKFKE